MNVDIGSLAKIILAARRRKLFRSAPIFDAHAVVSPDELRYLDSKVGTALPAALRDWLLAVGYGDIDDELSFREAWFAALETGPLQGSATFAQDTLGNFYAFDAAGRIYFLARSEPAFTVVAENFSVFVEELIRRDYKLGEWMDAVKMETYAR
ncbi:SMI1/KNR4 family protein [Chitinimonas koreensis]|uniref:SMI1/KNR4 family protein n=1 Tax=Chitinimonas koreensis TaxID=356302 RepID=UPI000491BD37|nr:SMI1/KNR4 family protein [Chitinimonas koreensis]QNM96727.1 SMI1/KNR4 family protein [Chitinimonas koreensis]